MKIGTHVLRAFWEVKKLEMNKNLLKQITDEANSKIKIKDNDDEDGSDEGCSSSEEDVEPPTSSKKVLQQIQESDLSPEPRKKIQENNTQQTDEKEKTQTLTGGVACFSQNSSRKHNRAPLSYG